MGHFKHIQKNTNDEVDDVVSGNNQRKGGGGPKPSIGKLSHHTHLLINKLKRNYPIEGWNAHISYRFNIIHLPEQGLIRLRLYEGSVLVVDSGNILDTRADRLRGGKLGVYCDSQENIIWSALSYRLLTMVSFIISFHI